MESFGNFYGVGVGPGCPELITIKAVKIIEISDVIYVPTKSTIEKSFAYSVIKKYVKEAIIKPALFPMTYDEDKLKNSREKIVDSIIDDLKKYKNVTLITIGDPMIYSTYSYILEILQKKAPGLSITTVPGISSINAIASKSNIPLVLEDEKFTIYPMTYFNEEEFKTIYESSDSILLMKVPKNSKKIFEFIKKFKFKNIVYMKNICKDGEVIRYDLDANELYEDTKKYFTIILLKK